MDVPATNYLDHDGVNIAWQAFGEGPAEIMIVPGWVSNVDQFWAYPDPREFLTELARFARVAMYDKPGTGASDPLETTPTVELRIEQLVAVMDAAGLRQPTVIAISEGGITACLAAAGRPDRVGRLVLLDAVAGGFDRRSKGELSHAEFDAWREFILATAERWGDGSHGDRWLAGASDPNVAWGRLQRACATPAVARRYMSAVVDGLSAWDALEAIHQPTLVMQRRDDPIVRAELARAEAARIPNARYVELEGAEHLPWLGDTRELLAQLREFVGAPPQRAQADRVLATVLFTDIVGSTEALVRLGDAAWGAKLERHARIIGEGLERFDGQLIKNTGDGVLATFTGPARGVEAARWILDALAAEGLHSRAGIHVGEIELQDGDISGLAVHVAARVMEGAEGSEVLASRTVRDLTAGSDLRFEDRGTHELKGVPGSWELYALA